MLSKFLRRTKITLPLKPFQSLSTLALTDDALPNSAFPSSAKYVSPYDMAAPLSYLIICNRSNYAVHTAEEDLKAAWPNLETIHVVQKGSDRVPGANMVIEVNSIEQWTSMPYIKRQFDQLAMLSPSLRAAMKANRVGFYDVWAAQGEIPRWASEVIAAGFKRIGASPDKMEQLDKLNLKRLCQKKNISTAYFVEIMPNDAQDENDCFRAMAEQIITTCTSDPKLIGKRFFLKHVNGGGGRGSVKLADLNPAAVEEAVRKVVKETGGNPTGVYIEEALDFKDRQLMQMELECDGPDRIEEECRFVFFNPSFQKVYEVGCTKKGSQFFIPKKIYDECRAAAKQLIQEVGYDNRGTIEILISIDQNKQVKYWISEINMRRQVEAPAIEYLVKDKQGRRRNTTAEQVARSCGMPAPGPNDFTEAGPDFAGHVRLLCGDISKEKGMTYGKGVTIDGAFTPPDAIVSYVRGALSISADAQLGRGLFFASTWQQLCAKLFKFSQEFQFYGPNTLSNYMSLFGRLAVNTRFLSGKMGCNEVFSVLSESPVSQGKIQKIVQHLQLTVLPLITHGYRRNQGIKDRPHPTRNQIKEYQDFMEKMMSHSMPETPFSRFLQHQDYNQFIAELKDQLEKHGGGTVSVIRDLIQSLMDQESALVQKSLTQIIQIHGARSGIIVGNEEGGAQYQAGEMRWFKWLSILIAGCPANLATHSLLRSIFMNGLTIKSVAKQKFVAKVLNNLLSQHYGWQSSNNLLPWEPNNFHAGNHPQGDITTRVLLQAKIPVIPNFAWEPSYIEEDFINWVIRQIKLFQEEGQPLHQIRIKNPGQNPKWNKEVIVWLVKTTLKLFEKCGLSQPIIHIHNHNFDGKASHIAAEAIKECQEMGYQWLIVDSVPHGFASHNSNKILSNVLRMDTEERFHLNAYNEGVHKTLKLLSRFNNQDITNEIQDPNSIWAGGTNSSDIADAIKLGVPIASIPEALALSKKLFGLGTPVTPYSEALKQVIFAVYINKEIQPKTAEAVQAYLEKGGKLMISDEILMWFSTWRTLLPRPYITELLLKNHGCPLVSNADELILSESLEIEVERRKLQEQLPNTLVTDEVLATYFMFDRIALDALKRRDHTKSDGEPHDMTLLMDSPDFVYNPDIRVGDSLKIEGEKITVVRIQRNLEAGKIDVDFELRGHIIRTSGIDPNAQETAVKKQARLVKDPNTECAAPMVSKLLEWLVKPGDEVEPNQTIARIEAMKMIHPIKAQRKTKIASILTEKDAVVEADEVMATFTP